MSREDKVNIQDQQAANTGALDESQLNELNQQLGDLVITGGCFTAGTSKLGKTSTFRPAFSNWRTQEQDVEEFAAVVVESGSTLA